MFLSASNDGAKARRQPARSLACLPALAICAVLAGCGSGRTAPRFGSISVTDLSGATQGQLSSVSVNRQASISIAVSNDANDLGVNWTAICGGSPLNPPAANPCGTISPANVGSNVQMIYTAPLYIPVGGTVTIVATSANDPAVNSRTTLTIVPQPITLAFSLRLPAVMGAGEKELTSVAVTNDTAAAGLNWSLSCGSSGVCGSLRSSLTNPTQTASGGQIMYTAPAGIPSGGTVTVTATSVSDPSKSVSATVSLAPIAVSAKPHTADVGAGATVQLTGTVTYDSANGGVDWGTPVCGSPGVCGSISLRHTVSGQATVYTAPSSIPAGGTVSVVAKSTADPSVADTVTLNVVPPPPIVVTVTPDTVSAQAGGTAQLSGKVDNDPANRGIDWTLSCSASPCGSMLSHTSSGNSVLYIAPANVPAGGTVTVTGTSTADPSKKGIATVTVVPKIGITFTPVPTSVTAGTAAGFTATVTGDTSSAGVDWTVTCTNAPCGTFTSGDSSAPNHSDSGSPISFTAPVGMPADTVTIKATATASTTALPLRTVTAVVTVTPVAGVNFLPYAPEQMQVSDPTLLTPPATNLTAVVSNDSTNAGVDWTVCGDPVLCGKFQVIPAIAATSTTPASNAVYSSTLHTASGQTAAYVPPTRIPAGGTVTITVKASNPTATSPLATAAAAVKIVQVPRGVALQGTVLAGTHPVAGAAVSLYAAGTSGYGSAAVPLPISGSMTSVTTDAAGQFGIPAGYNCPAQNSQMYLLSVGGDSGAGSNANMIMMAALGPCSGLSSGVNLKINEVTTVASVWSLAPFMSDPWHAGSSSSNATGLANAFATVNNLVNVVTGQALSVTPAGNGKVPQAEINTLANILNTCTSTSGGTSGDGSACGRLFFSTNASLLEAKVPANTVQAALNVAQTPSYNTVPASLNIFSLMTAQQPFTPVLTAAPNDWTIALSFSGGGLANRSAASAIAVDAGGSVWITNSRFSSVTQLNSLGAALSPSGTGTTQSTAGGYQGAGLNTPGAIAIDPLGNAWIANSSSLTELPFTTPLTYSGALGGGPYTGGGLTGPIRGLAVDGAGNVWTAGGGAPGNVSWFAGPNATINGLPTTPGTPLSPAGGFSQGIDTPSGAIGVDNAGTVWVLNNGSRSAAELTSTTGAFIQSDYGYTQALPYPVGSVLATGIGSGLSIDGSGNVFLSSGSQLLELYAGGNITTGGGLGVARTSGGNTYSQFLAVDGASHVWLMVTGGNAFCPYSPTVMELDSSGGALNRNANGCGYSGMGLDATADAMALDGSGDVWVLGSGAVTEMVGVAAPVVTPFSLGVQNKTLGKRP